LGKLLLGDKKTGASRDPLGTPEKGLVAGRSLKGRWDVGHEDRRELIFRGEVALLWTGRGLK